MRAGEVANVRCSGATTGPRRRGQAAGPAPRRGIRCALRRRSHCRAGGRTPSRGLLRRPAHPMRGPTPDDRSWPRQAAGPESQLRRSVHVVHPAATCRPGRHRPADSPAVRSAHRPPCHLRSRPGGVVPVRALIRRSTTWIIGDGAASSPRRACRARGRARRPSSPGLEHPKGAQKPRNSARTGRCVARVAPVPALARVDAGPAARTGRRPLARVTRLASAGTGSGVRVGPVTRPKRRPRPLRRPGATARSRRPGAKPFRASSAYALGASLARIRLAQQRRATSLSSRSAAARSGSPATGATNRVVRLVDLTAPRGEHPVDHAAVDALERELAPQRVLSARSGPIARLHPRRRERLVVEEPELDQPSDRVIDERRPEPVPSMSCRRTSATEPGARLQEPPGRVLEHDLPEIVDRRPAPPAAQRRLGASPRPTTAGGHGGATRPLRCPRPGATTSLILAADAAVDLVGDVRVVP